MSNAPSAGSQVVGILTDPPEVKVTVNGRCLGNTPVCLGLSRKLSYDVVLEKEGYETYIVSIQPTPRYAEWIIGNALCGGAIGLVIDAATGANYQLKPNGKQTGSEELPTYFPERLVKQIREQQKRGEMIWVALKQNDKNKSSSNNGTEPIR